MKIRQATQHDLPTIAQLEQTHLNAELTSDSAQMLGQGFTLEDLNHFLSQGWIVIAEIETKIIGYVICADWKAFKRWRIYNDILKLLANEHWHISHCNSCQYGPIWIDEHHRSIGVFEQLVSAVKKLSVQKYQVMVTFIAEENQHSYFAHTKKGNMQVLDFFEFEDRGYYLLTL